MAHDDHDAKRGWKDTVWERHRYNERTVLKSGSYLQAFCPHCGESLLRDDHVHLLTVNAEGESGWVELSPYLNVHERRSDIRLPEGVEVADLMCSACERSLRVDERRCDRGDSHVACVLVGVSSVRVPFYFCMRTGCRWHCIDPDDEHMILLDESTEW